LVGAGGLGLRGLRLADGFFLDLGGMMMSFGWLIDL
jgi:hypothetical protein